MIQILISLALLLTLTLPTHSAEHLSKNKKPWVAQTDDEIKQKARRVAQLEDEAYDYAEKFSSSHLITAEDIEKIVQKYETTIIKPLLDSKQIAGATAS